MNLFCQMCVLFSERCTPSFTLHFFYFRTSNRDHHYPKTGHDCHVGNIRPGADLATESHLLDDHRDVRLYMRSALPATGREHAQGRKRSRDHAGRFEFG